MQTSHPFKAALWMIGALTGFSSMAVAGRELSGQQDTFEIMLWRSLIGLVVMTVFALASGRRADLAPRVLHLHALRNLSHFIGQNLWLYALTLIPLAQLFAVEFSYPILVALAAPFLLAERMTPRRLASAAVGFAGILIVARPFGSGGISPGILMAMGAAVGFAGSAIVTKRLTRVASVTAILYWLCMLQLLFALVCAGWDGEIALPHGLALFWLLVIGLAGLGAHMCLTKALSLAPASIVTPIDFLRLPLIALVGMAFYHEPLDIWVLVGGAVIFAANWINIRAETRMPPAAAVVSVPHAGRDAAL